MLLGCFLTVYVLVALLTYSPVQSLLGAAVSSYFSKEWNATVRIGALHVDPFNRVIIHNLLLVDPQGDTVADVEELRVKWHHLPFADNTLSFDQVRIKNTFYYNHIKEDGINLEFIIDYFASKDTTPSTEPSKPFKLCVKRLDLSHVHYKQDLGTQSQSYANLEHGVNISKMDFLNVDGHLKNVQVGVDGDHIDVLCRFVRFAAQEVSGFSLTDLSGDVHVSDHCISFQNMELSTPYTHILSNINMDYDGWESMGDFCNNVVFNVVFQPGTVLCFRDAAYWAPMALWGMETPVELDGVFYGPVGAMHAEDVHIALGNSTRLDLEAFVKGLPIIDNAVFNAKVHNLHTTYTDLASVKHPEGVTMKVPELMRNLSIIDLDADFDGSQNQCSANVVLNSAIGDLMLNMEVEYDEFNNYHMKTSAASHGIHISPLWKNEWVSRSSFMLTAEGFGHDMAHLKMKLDGRFYDTYLKGTRIKGAQINGEYEGHRVVAQLQVDDTLLRLQSNFDIVMNDTMQVDVDMDIEELHPTKLHLLDGDANMSFKSRLHGNARFSDLESIDGSLALSGIHFQNEGQDYLMTNCNLNVHSVEGYKNISLNSDVAALTVKGYFAYSEIPLMLNQIVSHTLPNSLQDYINLEQVNDYSSLKDNSLDADLRWSDKRLLMCQLVPNLHIAGGTHWHASYNYSQGLKMVLKSDSIRYGPLVVRDLGLDGHPADSGYQLQFDASTLATNGDVHFDQFAINVNSYSSGMLCGLQWNNSPAEIENEGALLFELYGADSISYLLLHPTDLVIQDHVWHLNSESPVTFAPDFITVDNVYAYCDSQRIEFSASWYDHADDYAVLRLNDFQVERLLNLFLNGDLDIEGRASGELKSVWIDGKEMSGLKANLDIQECRLNGYSLGSIDLMSIVDQSQQRVNVDVTNRYQLESKYYNPLRLQGFIDLSKEVGELHAVVDFDSLSLAVLTPFLRSFSDHVDGDLSGRIFLDGPLQQLNIKGDAMVQHGVLNILPTGATYYFSDSLHVANSEIRFSNFTIRDEFNNSALVDGLVSLGNFDNMELDVHLRTPNIVLVDKPKKDKQFYGRLFAAVDAKVSGPIESLSMQLSARTRPGSVVTVPIDNRKEMSELDYISFANTNYTPAYSETEEEIDYRTHHNALNLNANLNITPDLQLYLPMSFSQMGVNITAKGSGDLSLTKGFETEPQLVGSYEINNGSLRLNLLGFFEKSFAIESGSSVVCPGDLNNAHFDINAVYSQRVSLSTLTSTLSEKAQQRVQVDNVIAVAGSIDNPIVKFDIRLPNADQTVTDEVFSFIDRNDEREMLNQTVTLLLSGAFYNSDNSNSLNTAANSGYNLVANSMGTVVSNMIKVVDVNFDYKSATASTTEQFDVDISKEWDKFYFETTIGYGGETRTNGSTARATNLVGDVTVGYKFSQQLQAFVFNRSNTNDFTRTELPYKQGAGIKFLRDFNNWKDLFRKQKHKRSNPKRNQQ